MSTTKQTDSKTWVYSNVIPRLGKNRINVAKRDKVTGITTYADSWQRMPNGDLIDPDGKNHGKVGHLGGLK